MTLNSQNMTEKWPAWYLDILDLPLSLTIMSYVKKRRAQSCYKPFRFMASIPPKSRLSFVAFYNCSHLLLSRTNPSFLIWMVILIQKKGEKKPWWEDNPWAACVCQLHVFQTVIQKKRRLEKVRNVWRKRVSQNDASSSVYPVNRCIHSYCTHLHTGLEVIQTRWSWYKHKLFLHSDTGLSRKEI